MGFAVHVKLESAIFNDEERKRALSEVVSRNAREFRDSTKQKIIESQPTGKEYRRGKGADRRTHRASAKGERVSSDTGALVSSIDVQNVSMLENTVLVGVNYAEILVDKLGREIFTDEDISEARQKFLDETNKTISQLL